MNKLRATDFYVEDRNNSIRNRIQKAGDELTRVQLVSLWSDTILLKKSPAPAKQGRIISLLDLVDHIGQIEPRTRTVQNLIDALRNSSCISAADILEREFESNKTSLPESPEFEF